MIHYQKVLLTPDMTSEHYLLQYDIKETEICAKNVFPEMDRGTKSS